MRSPKCVTNVAFSAAPRTPALSSPSSRILSPRSGEYSYALLTPALISRLHSAAGNRLTASLRKGVAVSRESNQLQASQTERVVSCGSHIHL